MKMILKTVIGILFMSSMAMAGSGADPIRILPICAAQGPVYLVIGTNEIQGWIGETPVNFKKEGIYVYGDINGYTVKGYFTRNNTVNGMVADKKFMWRVNQEGDTIYGFQPCFMLEHLPQDI